MSRIKVDPPFGSIIAVSVDTHRFEVFPQSTHESVNVKLRGLFNKQD